MSEPMRFQAPLGGMNFALAKYGLPTEYATSIVNGICRNGTITSRGGLGSIGATESSVVGNAQPKKWLHTFANGANQQTVAVTTGADVYKLTPAVASIYAGSGTVTESNAVMFDGKLQYTLYPAAAPRTWDGVTDAALTFTRPATGDWGSSYGIELVTNGDFASGTGWTTGAGWAIGAGVATATATTGILSRSVSLTAGTRYEITYTVAAYTGGTVRCALTGGVATNGTARTANGTYTEILTAVTGNNTIAIEGTVAFTATVDNVSVKEVLTLQDSDVTGFCVHKSRVWYWSRKSDEACYTALLARGGTLVRFPLAYVAETGGNIVLIESLTMDGGNGPDDFLAFLLDTGEALIYQGSDPASASDWSIVGRFRVPPPLNGKCVTRIGGDSLMLTQAGLIPLQNYIKAAFGQTNVDWLEKINPLIRSISPTDGRLVYVSSRGILLAQCGDYLLCMDVKTGGWSYWTVGTYAVDALPVRTATLTETTATKFEMVGAADIGGTLYILGYDLDGASDVLFQYNTGNSDYFIVKWGWQFSSGPTKSAHAIVFAESTGQGEINAYMASDNSTLGFEFAQPFVGQVEFNQNAISRAGSILQLAITCGDETAASLEGAFKLVGVTITNDRYRGL